MTTDIPADAYRIGNEAFAHAAAGEILQARAKHHQAARLLIRSAERARQIRQKHWFRFLAANQYAHAGLPQEAKRIVGRVEGRFLPIGTEVFNTLVRNVNRALKTPKRKRLDHVGRLNPPPVRKG